MLVSAVRRAVPTIPEWLALAERPLYIGANDDETIRRAGTVGDAIGMRLDRG